jgi:hypothetical protein
MITGSGELASVVVPLQDGDSYSGYQAVNEVLSRRHQ